MTLLVTLGDGSSKANLPGSSVTKGDTNVNSSALNNGFNGLLGSEKATLFVSGSKVNVRAGPGVGNNILGQLSLGDEAKLLSSTGGWRQIQTKFGVGWMSAKYLSPEMPKSKPPAAAQPRQRTVAVPSSREIQSARNEIILQSIASYQGSCPCPYNTDRAGRRCGKRSAWSRPGGYSPI